jgi:hypothetical protein
MSHRRSSGRFSLIQVDESDMYTLIHLYFTPGPALLSSSINVAGLQRYVRPVKLSLRFVAMFPVRLPSLAKESSAISAVCQLSSAYREWDLRRVSKQEGDLPSSIASDWATWNISHLKYEIGRGD